MLYSWMDQWDRTAVAKIACDTIYKATSYCLQWLKHLRQWIVLFAYVAEMDRRIH